MNGARKAAPVLGDADFWPEVEAAFDKTFGPMRAPELDDAEAKIAEWRSESYGYDNLLESKHKWYQRGLLDAANSLRNTLKSCCIHGSVEDNIYSAYTKRGIVEHGAWVMSTRDWDPIFGIRAPLLVLVTPTRVLVSHHLGIQRGGGGSKFRGLPMRDFKKMLRQATSSLYTDAYDTHHELVADGAEGYALLAIGGSTDNPRKVTSITNSSAKALEYIEAMARAAEVAR